MGHWCFIRRIMIQDNSKRQVVCGAARVDRWIYIICRSFRSTDLLNEVCYRGKRSNYLSIVGGQWGSWLYAESGPCATIDFTTIKKKSFWFVYDYILHSSTCSDLVSFSGLGSIIRDRITDIGKFQFLRWFMRVSGEEAMFLKQRKLGRISWNWRSASLKHENIYHFRIF